MKTSLLSILVLGLGLGLANAQNDGDAPAGEQDVPEIQWRTDWNAAKAEAAAAKKDLFVDFTGSDWCSWCKRLEKEVFSQDAFAKANHDKFVFVYLDFPNAQPLKDRVVDPELNQKLAKEYGVRGYPTIVLATADGAPYASTGYRPDGAEPYNAHLAELHKSGKAVQAAYAAEKPDAATLKTALTALDEADLLGWSGYAKLLDAAKKLDPDGKEGLKPLILAHEEKKELEAKIESYGDEPPADWIELADFLDARKNLKGQMFINVALGTAMQLLEAGHPARAKTLIERVGKLPEVKENEELAKFIQKQMTACEEAMKKATEKSDDEEVEETPAR